MSDEPITDATTLSAGDVVIVAVETARDRWQGGGTYWWTRFAVVTGVYDQQWFHALTLKLDPGPRDDRAVDLRKDVVRLVPKDKWPDGVAAIYMKLLHTGRFTLEGGI